MLNAFSSISRPAEMKSPTPDLNGKWKNELGSEMLLTVAANGQVTGRYQTMVGSPGDTEEFDLIGFASGDLLSFTVNFGKYYSLTSWVGQHTEESGVEIIKTLWLLAKNVEDEPGQLWGAVLTGYNNFNRVS